MAPMSHKAKIEGKYKHNTNIAAILTLMFSHKVAYGLQTFLRPMLPLPLCAASDSGFQSPPPVSPPPLTSHSARWSFLMVQ